MKKGLGLFLILGMMFLVSGCYTTGLSTRETGGFNYSNFVYGLYDDQSQTKDVIKSIKRPIKLAVAQVGESAPPKSVLEKFTQERSLISKVMELPAGGAESNYYNNNQNQNNIQEMEKRMQKMRQLAKDLGADYLFLFGGSADVGEAQSWLGFFDITMIGMFVIPSQKIMAEGKAAGALIDVETGRVVFTVNAQSNLDQNATTYNLYGKRDETLIKLRDTLVETLTEQFFQKLRTFDGEI